MINKIDNPEIAKVKTWLDEIVIGLNFCPFAAKSHRNKQVRFVTSNANREELLLIDLQAELTLLDQKPASKTETTLLIITDMLSEFEDYNQFLELSDQLLIEYEWEGIFQIASFHPNYCFADTPPDSIENFTNRSPYPILHILRESSIENAVDKVAAPDEIYKNNIKTLNNLSADNIKDLFN
ncbi:MAG: DUF1415 domain-containing protein [Gammaproteobacteria bacterium]